MFRPESLAATGAVVALVANLFAGPATAHDRDSNIAGFIALGAIALSLQDRSKHRVHRYYIAPQPKPYVRKPKVHHSKPYAPRRYKGAKRRAHGYYPYYVPVQRPARSHRFNRGYRYYGF